MKNVTQAEFDQFVATYPRPLRRGVAYFCEPPMVTFCDPSLGEWPHSVVARHGFEDRNSQVPSDWAVKEEA